MRTTLATVALICGLTALLGNTVYCVGFRPEWTQAQAFRAQWPVLAIGVAFMGIGLYLLDR